MGWRDLLNDEKVVVLPWVGGRSLRYQGRTWSLITTPPHTGWASFELRGQKARFLNFAEPNYDVLEHRTSGYLVGVSSLVLDNISVHTPIAQATREVHFCDTLEKFSRVIAGSVFPGGPLFYVSQDFPKNPDSEALPHLESDSESLETVSEVTPALDVAYRIELTYRRETEKRRQEELARVAAEELQRQRDEFLRNVRAGRDISQVGLEEAARAALAISQSTLLSIRTTSEGHVVRFMLRDRRFECVCNSRFGIIDAGICLTGDDGYKWDSTLTLESLPPVIAEAIDTGVLHVFRRA